MPPPLELARAGVAPRIMIDTSHANSCQEAGVPAGRRCRFARQVSDGDQRITGVMIESNLVAGRQDVVPGNPLTYGQSITDGCIGWDTTVSTLNVLADSVTARRNGRSQEVSGTFGIAACQMTMTQGTQSARPASAGLKPRPRSRKLINLWRMSHRGIAFRNILPMPLHWREIEQFRRNNFPAPAFFGQRDHQPRHSIALGTILLAPIPALAAADPAHIQFCWTIGKFDHTVYYAEVENREDRQASFEALLEISGIDHHAVKCNTSDLTSFRLTRPALVRDWLKSEFEVVNTTFLSDLDYKSMIGSD